MRELLPHPKPATTDSPQLQPAKAARPLVQQLARAPKAAGRQTGPVPGDLEAVLGRHDPKLTARLAGLAANAELGAVLKAVVAKLTANRNSLENEPDGEVRITKLNLVAKQGDVNGGDTTRTDDGTELTIIVKYYKDKERTDEDAPIVSAVLADELYTVYQLLITRQVHHFWKKSEPGSPAGWDIGGYDAVDELETKIASVLALRAIGGKTASADQYRLPDQPNASLRAMKLIEEIIANEPNSTVASVRDKLLATKQYLPTVPTLNERKKSKDKPPPNVLTGYKDLREFASDPDGYSADLNIQYNSQEFIGKTAAKLQKNPKAPNANDEFMEQGKTYLRLYYQKLFAFARQNGQEKLTQDMRAHYPAIADYLKDDKKSSLSADELTSVIDKVETKELLKSPLAYRFPPWDF